MNDTDRAGAASGSPTEERDLRRSDEGRMLTGVCAGLGRYAGIDPVLIRVGFAVLVLGSGIGIMLYVAAFLLMREADGGPGHLGQWSGRDFDSETALTLLTGVFAIGLLINISSNGVGTGTVVVGTVFAIALLAAHSRGVDLLAVARSLPDRLRRRPTPQTVAPHPVQERDPVVHATTFPDAQTVTPRPVEKEDPAGRAAAFPDAPSPSYVARPVGDTVTERYAPAPEADPPEPRVPGPSAPRQNLPPNPYPGASSFDSSGVPFSPYGPYQPLDPRKRRQSYSPGPSEYDSPRYNTSGYDLSGYGETVTAPPRARRPSSPVGGVTLILAMIVGGIIMAIQSASGPVSMTVAGGAALIVIGTGLLVATWFGRGAGLVATGTILSIALVVGPMLGGMPKKFGDYDWRPATLSEVARSYSVGVGEGLLDLSDVILPAGSRTIIDASISIGEISVILPATVRAEVNGSTRFGDVKIDHSVEGGADIQHNRILEPEITPEGDAATIVLNIKAGIGDVEVRRAA